jgi:acetolactate synthase I/II/III large subunit
MADHEQRSGTKASDLFIQCLEEEGVEYIFGVPGEENLDFLDSACRDRPRSG